MYNTSNAQEPNTPKVHDHKGNLQHLSDSVSTNLEAMNEGSTHQIAISKPALLQLSRGNSIRSISSHSTRFSLKRTYMLSIELFRFSACLVTETAYLCGFELVGRLVLSNSVFEFQSPYCHDSFKRKIVVDYIVGELGKKPNSIIFLDNVDKVDFLVQSSLLKATRTGRFRTHLERKSASTIPCLLYPARSIMAAATAQLLIRKGQKCFLRKEFSRMKDVK
ncbi:hypothetical protein AHAS_Ahas01G0039500 [Arachis hypogaea]|uniref:Uncharacterized protein n=1 Tax=Arachis hypogaea TaxID=3818 RepID=A0A445EVZ6_ARAHY|nr:hypothetical protein Ahy_A01g004407 [Arachis hypogaea]